MITKFFDRAMIEELVNKKPDRIYYCGPSSIEQTIRKV
jgi:ferredoxin-NADP reductase